MQTAFRLAWILPLLAIVPARGQAPTELVTAVRHLQAQDSYSWEVINGDPGLVAQDIHTRIGTVKTLQQNTSPHVVGRLASNGEMLFQRDWADGVQLDTFVAAGGAMITKTPDGWLTSQEVLTALANERVDSDQLTERASWLKRADRPSARRPDEELGQLLQSGAVFEPSADGYIGKLTVNADGIGGASGVVSCSAPGAGDGCFTPEGTAHDQMFTFAARVRLFK